MKHKLLFLSLLLHSLVASADAVEIDGIYYSLNGNEASVTGNPDNYTGDIVIPSTVYYNDSEYEVVSIEDGAFRDCNYLTSIAIPNCVTNIGSNVFRGCSCLTSITIPRNVTNIGSFSFAECSSLNSICVEEDNMKYDSRDNCNAIIETETNKLIAGCKETVIPNNVTSIGDAAFSGCSGLLSILIPTSVTNIESYAFQECGLISVTIPTNVTHIGSFAFYRCTGLQSITIPKSVEGIGSEAFSWCFNLTSINVEAENTIYDSRDNCNAIIETETNTLRFGCKNTTIPNSVTAIGSSAFYKCITLKSILIPDNVKSIGVSAFAGCDGLTSISIPNSVTTIGSNAFSYCGELSVVIMSNNVTSIEYRTFSACSKLSNIKIPNGVKSIGDWAFQACKGLHNILIPNSVTTIGNGAFDQCTGLTGVTIEKTKPINITAGVFTNRTNATLYIPKGFKSSYEVANYWNEFNNIIEYDAHATIAMGSTGITTYSNNSDLDFTNVEGLKAYIGSGYSPSTGELTMTRVYEVPAGEGLLLKGAAGDYEIPYTETDMYYSNLLVGVPTATTVNPTEGDYTNFILSKDEVRGIGFYPLASAGEIGANKAYLQLPTSILPAASRSLRMVFDDEEDVTGIKDLNEKGAMRNEKFFDLQGRRVVKPTRGLYIKDGKKIMVK